MLPCHPNVLTLVGRSSVRQQKRRLWVALGDLRDLSEVLGATPRVEENGKAALGGYLVGREVAGMSIGEPLIVGELDAYEASFKAAFYLGPHLFLSPGPDTNVAQDTSREGPHGREDLVIAARRICAQAALDVTADSAADPGAVHSRDHTQRVEVRYCIGEAAEVAVHVDDVRNRQTLPRASIFEKIGHRWISKISRFAFAAPMSRLSSSLMSAYMSCVMAVIGSACGNPVPNRSLSGPIAATSSSMP